MTTHRPWRSYLPELTATDRRLLELREAEGVAPEFLSECAADLAESFRFQRDCDLLHPGDDGGVSASIWYRPDEDHDATFREITITSEVVDCLRISAVGEVDLDGAHGPAIVEIAETVRLSPADARRVASLLLAASVAAERWQR